MEWCRVYRAAGAVGLMDARRGGKRARLSKVNFYGTLNLWTGQQHITRTLSLNSPTTAQHLQTLLDAYPEQPLLLLWDRAPWHHGQPLRDLLAANPRLDLLVLPVAAPDLNPQGVGRPLATPSAIITRKRACPF